MAAPSITLANGEVLVTESSSTLGIYGFDYGEIKFGTVQAVYATSDKTTVGDAVMFNPKNAKQFFYGSTRYLIINENNISGKEPAAV